MRFVDRLDIYCVYINLADKKSTREQIGNYGIRTAGTPLWVDVKKVLQTHLL